MIDWLGDNWEQHGVEAVILDDYIHCAGADNKKIHSMNNNDGISLRIIPIDNVFVGLMHYDADNAKKNAKMRRELDILGARVYQAEKKVVETAKEFVYYLSEAAIKF